MIRHLSFLCLSLAMIPSVVFAAPKGGEKAGTVGAVTPYVEKRSGSCGDDAKKTTKIADASFRERDCFMTDDGASVQLLLKGENSSITINEKSLVSVDSLVDKDENGSFKIRLGINKGLLGFDVRKGNNVGFRTGTAAASIRGTKGVIGGDEDVFQAGLIEGDLWISPNNGEPITISKGQTVLGRKKFVTLNLKSSGDTTFAKTLAVLLADTSKSMEELVVAAVAADSAYQESLRATSEKSQASSSVGDSSAADMSVPQINYTSYDSLRCVANVAVSNIQKGSEVSLATFMDGSSISEVTMKRNMPKHVRLRSGVHEYEFVVENKAGRNSVKKTLGCYPKKPFTVKVFGDKVVHVQIPPAPPKSDDAIIQTLQFQIRLPENDPSLLNKVTIRQNGKVILQERLSQIQNLDYQIPVELQRGRRNTFVIDVVHKSGYVFRTVKIYEVEK